MGNIHTVGPNEALVASGGCVGNNRRVIVGGGYVFAAWFVTRVDRLSMEVITVTPRCEDVETLHGVAVTVTGVAQVKFMSQKDILSRALEQFLGRTVPEIANVIVQTLEGHLRAILGTLSVEEIYQDREKFAAMVKDVIKNDLAMMGVEVLSFTIKDVSDKVNYLDSLGKKRTAEVKRDADIGMAAAKRDSGIKQVEAQRAHMDVKFQADSAVADAERAYNIVKAKFEEEVNTKKADANLAYELQAAKVRQRIRAEIVEIDVVERRKQIEVEEQEIMRRDRELEAIIRKPADAERFKVETLAEAEKTATVVSAQAEAESIRLLGAARAQAIELLGRAEADEMKMKAAAFKQYGDAAIMAMVLEALPKIAAEIAAPLARTDRIVLLSGDGGRSDRLTSEISSLVASLPPSVQAIAGVDLMKALERVMQAGGQREAITASSSS